MAQASRSLRLLRLPLHPRLVLLDVSLKDMVQRTHDSDECLAVEHKQDTVRGAADGGATSLVGKKCDLNNEYVKDRRKRWN